MAPMNKTLLYHIIKNAEKSLRNAWLLRYKQEFLVHITKKLYPTQFSQNCLSHQYLTQDLKLNFQLQAPNVSAFLDHICNLLWIRKLCNENTYQKRVKLKMRWDNVPQLPIIIKNKTKNT